MCSNMLAISTAWNYSSHSDPKEMLSEIKEIGFSAIEIGYSITQETLKELIPLIEAMELEVVSVHNFCPLPPKSGPKRFLTDYYRLSSLDERERKKAVEYTKRSVDTARLFSCEAVVIHAGTVELKNNYVREIFCLYNEGRRDSEEYLRAKDRLLAARRALKAAYLESVARSLEDILSYADSAGVKIGLETRYYPHEIPDFEEIGYLLGLFKDKGLVYWHDVGHAEVNERLGIAAHRDYLRNFADWMKGVHFHDLIGIDDHRAPFSGDLDFSKITPYIQNNLIKVIEAHPPATRWQIKEAIKRLQ